MDYTQVRNEHSTPYVQPLQRVHSSEKVKASWYIPNANWVIRMCLARNRGKVQTKKFLDAANGLVDKRTYDYVMRNYTNVLGDKGEQYGEIRDIDFLTPIKEKCMGEFINTFENFQVLNNDASIVLSRNKELSDKVMGWVNQQVINELNKKGFPTNQQSQVQEPIDKTIDKFLEEWTDKVVISAQDRLNLINSITEAKEKYIHLYFHWWACEECYDYREVFNDEVYTQVIHPMEMYPVMAGNRYVEDSDYVTRVYRMSYHDILVRFRDELKDDEVEYLRKLATCGAHYDPHVGLEWVRSLADFAERKYILDRFKTVADQEHGVGEHELNIYHYQWKTEVPEGILIHLDAFGNEVETRVDEHYKLQPELGDIEIKWIWTVQAWEGWRLGGMANGVYIKPRPLAVQRERFNNTSDCKLAYNGIIGLTRDNIRNPVPYRLLPYVALYRIYTLQQERAIARFKTWMLLPESVIGDSDQMTTEERFALANKDGYLPIDDADMGNNALQSFREVANTATINFINALEAIKQGIKRDAYEEASMNGARMGDTADYAGKGLTEMNYQNALTGSVWSLEMFNLFRERSYLANLDYSKVAWINGKQGSYIDPVTGKPVIVDIDGTTDFSKNLSVYIRNNTEVNNKLRQMQELAFAAE